MRYEIVSGKEYPVYSREEADELGLSYKHPYHTLEGEYGISSENEVAECLKRSVLKNGRISVKYPWGPSFVYSEKDNINSEGRVNNYTINVTKTATGLSAITDHAQVSINNTPPDITIEVHVNGAFYTFPNIPKAEGAADTITVRITSSEDLIQAPVLNMDPTNNNPNLSMSKTF